MIEKTITTQNGAVVSFHAVLRAEVAMPLDMMVVRVNSYTSEEAYLQGMDVLCSDVYSVPMLNIAGSLLDHIELHLTTSDTSALQGGVIVGDNKNSLDTLKARKRAEITRSRIEADASYFIYQGKAIRTAAKDMSDLMVADGRMSKGIPANWPGGWKAIDDSYIPISTVEEWNTFYIAMYDAGIANFVHSQQLKSLLAAAETPEQVAAIKWGMI